MSDLILPAHLPTYAMRLVAYTPNGPRLGLLPYPLSFETGHPLNDVSSLSFAYSTHARGAEWLAGPCEVAVEVSDGESWWEPEGGRFLRIKRGVDLTDRTGTVKYTCPGYAWMARKAVLYPNSAMVEGKRPFNAVSPGAILRTVLNEAHARGAVPGLVASFTASTDSAGQPWAHTMTLAVDPGTDLLTLLLNLGDQGVIDWCMTGRTLEVYNPETALARNLADQADPVDLRLGRDVDQAPDDGTLEDLSNAILIAGENGFTQEVTNPEAIAPWGRWETFQSQSGVSDNGTAIVLGQSALGRASQERVQITRGILFGAHRFAPWLHYAPGDTILAPGDGGVMQPLRIRQITLSRDQDGSAGGNLVLNDRFLELEIKLARKAEGILTGGVSSGGTGGTPVPESAGRAPDAPEGLVLAAAAYVDEHGWARGALTATWAAVTADTNGVAIDVDSYEVYARDLTADEGWALLTSTSGETTAHYSPLICDREYAVKVRATAEGVKGAFCGEATVLVPGDVTPPQVPSTPAVSTRMSVIAIAWDGKGANGAGMPADFDHVTVWMSVDDQVTWMEVGTLRAAGACLVTDQEYGQLRWFRLTATDRRGNTSDPSDVVSIATQALVDTDVIGQIISGANIQDGTLVAAEKIVAESITGGLIQALAIQAGHLAANSVTADTIAAGAITAVALAADAIDGMVITGAFIRTAATGQRLELAPPDATVPELRFYPGSGANYSVIQTRDDLQPGEATLVITSSQDAAAQYRAQLQMGAKMTTINVMDETASAPKGGKLEIASTHGRFGYYSGSAATETYLHNDSSGIYYIRGRFRDEAQVDAYDAVSVGTSTWAGNGSASYNYGWVLYPATMATLMGVVATLRDGGAGNTRSNTYVPKAWACTWNDKSGFQINLEGATGFELSWWNHRH
ncbi:hypothetical protein AB0C10_15725 [Microbispora amethystogenes]|uniref:hypothetical protein n=1 Tax=Microbispora amethystogenes TaxID=1427754 RepID=UPI0033F55899